MKNVPKSEIIEIIEAYKQNIKKLEKELESKSTTIEIKAHKFEVYHEDCKFKLNHDDAVKYCKNLGGDGWRLPTLKEQLEMYDHQEGLGLKGASYWSSTEINSTDAFYVNFSIGNASSCRYKSNTLSVRAVRTIED